MVPASARYGDSTTTSGTPGTCRSKSARTFAAWSGSSEMNTARMSSPTERPTLIACTVARSSPGIGTTTRSSRIGGPTIRSGRTASSALERPYWRLMNSIIATRSGTRITTRYAPSRNFSNTTIPRTTAVRTPPKAFTASRHCQPDSRTSRQWLDHAGLAEGEAQEHADRVERDERVGVATERPQQPEGDGGQQDDAPRERESIATERELARHVAVLGKDRGQAREGVEARVRGEEQDQRGGARQRRGRTANPRRTSPPPPSRRSTGHLASVGRSP